MDNFTFIGTIRPIKDNDKLKGYEEKTFDSGWTNRQLKFNVTSGTNSLIVQIKGGCFTDSKGNPKSDNKVYTSIKGKDKAEKAEIPWNDRKKASWLEKVVVWKKLVIDTELPEDRKKIYAIRKSLDDGTALTDDQYKFLNVDTIEAAKEAIEKRARHEYLSEWDYAEIVNKYIAKVGKDDMFRVSGNIEISYDAENNTAYKNYIVTKIEKMPADTAPTATAVIDVFFNKEAFDATDWIETPVEGSKLPKLSGVGIVNAKQSYFASNKKYNIKGTFYTDIVFEVPASTVGYALKFKMSAAFDKDVAWKHIPVRVKVIDGAPVVDLTPDMLTDEQKLDIECGCYTLEELQKSMSNVYGEKVRKYVFDSFIPNKVAEDTAFTDEDMVEAHSTEQEEVAITKEEEQDVFEDIL